MANESRQMYMDACVFDVCLLSADDPHESLCRSGEALAAMCEQMLNPVRNWRPGFCGMWEDL